MIHGAPEVMCLAVDPHEYFIEIPSQQRKLPMMNPPLSDLSGEYRAEPVPPKPDSFVTDINATLEQNMAMSLSLLKFVGQASLVDDAMLPS